MNILDVIKIVSNFQRDSGIDTTKKPIPIDNNLVKYIGNHLKLKNTKITVRDIRCSNKIIFGYIRRFENKIDIGVNDNLNPCRTRFVTCKELSHILIGHNGAGTTGDPIELVNAFYSKMFFGYDDALDHEHLAMICATEIMMPFESSQALLEDKNTTSLDIAQQFKIPLYIVQLYRIEFLNKRRKYYESLN